MHDTQRPNTGREIDGSTCRAIGSSREFRRWYYRQGGSNERILWLTGAPGSGKSTQLRHIRCQIEKYWTPATTSIIYCVAEGADNHSVSVPEPGLGRMRSVKVIRSILLQLFPQDPDLRRRLCNSYYSSLSDTDLTRFFVDDYLVSKPQTLMRRTFIFVDAEDSYDDAQIRELLHCFCILAQNSNFSICLASRLIDGRIATNIDRVELEKYNCEDIVRSVQTRLRPNWRERDVTANKVAEQAGGCFLWARFATDLLQDILDDGAAQDLVDKILGALPTDLYGLYELTLAALSRKEKADTMTIMRWVMLSPEPMLLSDLQMAVRRKQYRFFSFTVLDIQIFICWKLHMARGTHQAEKIST